MDIDPSQCDNAQSPKKSICVQPLFRSSFLYSPPGASTYTFSAPIVHSGDADADAPEEAAAAAAAKVI